jgi:hypothetical protein
MGRADVRHRVEFLYGAGSFVYMVFLLLMNAKFNHAFFSRGLSSPSQAWLAGPLSWLITLLLLLVFVLDLLGDVRRQLHPLAFQKPRWPRAGSPRDSPMLMPPTRLPVRHFLMLRTRWKNTWLEARPLGLPAPVPVIIPWRGLS